ncbi:TPA: hypothetical protein HA242_01460 [Candidatus Woesearchaeota archaeon]|nr:hypothetical protein [Candidatus Woesearchaeota archaeon]HIG92689.1 hypothetical protein [Candidatus Woesearchaeota archaeon]HIH12366.1 hypothetical protein [Candidatus Woesearchaeota archaeon]
MKRKYLVLSIGLFICSIVVLFLIFEYSTQQTTSAACCQECQEAFSSSPAAVGPSQARCGEFTTGRPLSPECQQYFDGNRVMVSECAKE